MIEQIYFLLDYFFIILHTILILFNLFGWLVPKFRIYNLFFILLTFGSWIFLGFWYGFGFCPLTEWHFQVLEKLGQKNLPDSYIKYMLDRLIGLNLNEKFINVITFLALLIAFIFSLYTNIKYKKIRILRMFDSDEKNSNL